MDTIYEYSRKERFWLWSLSVFGFLIINSAFIYGLFFSPEMLFQAMNNPVAAAFILEAFLIMGALAYIFTRWGVMRLNWVWFIVLSLLGSIAFALPIVLLWPKQSNSPKSFNEN